MEANRSIQSFFFTSQLIHGSMVAAVGLVSVVIYTWIDPQRMDQDASFGWRYIVLGVMVGSVGLGFFLFRSTLRSLNRLSDLRNKLQKYRQAILIRSALFEVSGFVSAAAALVTNNISFLLFSIVALVLLLLYRPSRISFLNEAEVSTKELEMIKNTIRKP